ncbi:MAG: hypothetical protein EAZ42_04470 [Verrucomicrobia bacterium]|nr:MAG: hypothetical protein EAZ42_04470 [Verrucomicrobiota bacterium]
MRIGKPKRPYFDHWLKRSRKQLAISGKLMQVAVQLSQQSGEDVDFWQRQLRDLLDGRMDPSLDLLTRVDAVLTGSAQPSKLENGDEQAELF